MEPQSRINHDYRRSHWYVGKDFCSILYEYRTFFEDPTEIKLEKQPSISIMGFCGHFVGFRLTILSLNRLSSVNWSSIDLHCSHLHLRNNMVLIQTLCSSSRLHSPPLKFFTINYSTYFQKILGSWTLLQYAWCWAS